MRRKRQLIVIFMSLLLFIFLAGKSIVKEVKAYILPIGHVGKVMGIAIVENTDFLQGMEKYSGEGNHGIYFEGVELPYNESNNTLYLPQNFEEEEWQGIFSTEEDNAYLCALRDGYWSEKAAAIKDNHTFTLWLVTEEGYQEYNLVVSGMPMISIDTEHLETCQLPSLEEDPDEAIYGDEILLHGEIRVFNPGVGSVRYEILECGVEYHLKGENSLYYDKKGYAIKLKDRNGENLNQELLGMRSDNSWKLNALVSDNNRIREKSAAQIWEKIDLADETLNTAGPRMEYVELVIDNDYLGLYCLVEPVDEKKLELDGNDALYKIASYFSPSEEEFQTVVENQWKTVAGIRLRYPKVIQDYEAAWAPLENYYSTFYKKQDAGSAVEPAESIDTEVAGEKVYPGNVADMMIFTLSLNAWDNFYKNTYLAADVATDGSYVMRRVPWDVDLVFGTMYYWGEAMESRFIPQTDAIYVGVETPFLIENNVDNIKDILWERWIAYRRDFLSKEGINQILTENKEYLSNTGVMKRENARWPQYQMDLEIDYLLQYQEEHMLWLDGYIQSLVE